MCRPLVVCQAVPVDLVLIAIVEVLVCIEINVMVTDHTLLSASLYQAVKPLDCLIALDRLEVHHLLHPVWGDDYWILDLLLFLLPLLDLLPDQLDNRTRFNGVNHIEEVRLGRELLSGVAREELHEVLLTPDDGPDVLDVEVL